MGCLNIKRLGEIGFKNLKLNRLGLKWVFKEPIFYPFLPNQRPMARASKNLRFQLRSKDEAISHHVQPQRSLCLTSQLIDNLFLDLGCWCSADSEFTAKEAH